MNLHLRMIERVRLNPRRPVQRVPSRRRTALTLETLEDRLVPTTFLVNTTIDDINNYIGSLRQAINTINSDPNPGPYTITFAPSLNTQAIKLDMGELPLEKSVTIIGNGPSNTIIDGQDESTVFFVENGATVTLEDLTIENGNAGTNVVGTGLPGGGIDNEGNLTIQNSLIQNNSAGNGGNGGMGAQGAGGVDGVDSNSDYAMNGGNGQNGGPGGNGGGIFNASTGVLTIENSTLAYNQAGNGGTGGSGGSGGSGDLDNPDGAGGGGGGGGGAGGSGGAIYNDGSLVVVNSTISFNAAGSGGKGGDGGLGGFLDTSAQAGYGYYPGGGGGGGGGGGSGSGGAIANVGSATVSIENSTVAQNSGAGAGEGGPGGSSGPESNGQGGPTGQNGQEGLFNTAGSGGSGALEYSSGQDGAAGVSGDFPAAGGILQTGGTVYVRNDIIFGNYGGDVSGDFASGGENLIGTTADSTGFLAPYDLIGVNPDLGPLQNNGGPTPTQAITLGSPAIDRGTNPLGLTTDQRGFPRTDGADIGAYEYYSVVSFSQLSGLVTTAAGGSASFTVVLAVAPISDVTVSLLSSNTAEGVPSASYLYFTPDNWNVPQQVQLTGRDDGLFDGDVAYSILTSVISADPQYNGVLTPSLSVTNVGIHQFVVSTAVDENDGNYSAGHLSLREAIELANQTPTSQILGVPNSITFSPALNGQPIDLTLGQIDITNAVTIDGNGASNTVIDAQQLSRIFDVTSSAGDVTLDGLTLENGRTTGTDDSGGAILFQSASTLTITLSALEDNSTSGGDAPGGAIYTNSGAVTITDTTLAGNSTTGNTSDGGAIYTQTGTLTVIGSTLSGNTTSSAGSNGGAINAGSAAVIVTDSTISGNTAVNGLGGGIASGYGGIEISNSTIVLNHGAIGGGIYDYDGALTLQSTILALNTDNTTNPAASSASSNQQTPIVTTDTGTNPDLRPPNPGNYLDITDNIIGVNTGAGFPAGSPDPDGNDIGTTANPINPLLGPLANNGGPTETQALLAGSPAIDAGSNPLDLSTDQLGQSRETGSAVDIGAFELQTPPDYALAGTPTQRFVQHFYHELLGSDAGAHKLAYYSKLVHHGVSFARVAQIIERSKESRTLVVHAVYQKILGRSPDRAEQAFSVQFLGEGGTEAQLEAVLFGSKQFRAQNGGTNSGFVRALSEDVLYRAASSKEVQTSDRILKRGRSRTALARTMIDSREASTLEAQVLYHEFLHRAADPAGLKALSTALRNGTSEERAIALLIASPESFKDVNG